MGLFSKLSKNKQEAAGQDSGYYSSAADSAALERAQSKRASAADRNTDGAGARRSRAKDPAADPVLPEKKRARRRLVGAIALALAVAVGLPMLLDSEPKPLATDIAIQIPSKDKPADSAAPAAAAARPSRVDAAEALDKSEEIVKEVPVAKPAAAALPPAVATPAVVTPVAAATPATKPADKPVVTAAPVVAELKLHPEPKSAKDSVKESLKESSRAAEAKLEAEAKAKAKAKAEETKHAKAEADAKEAKAKAEADARHAAEVKHAKAEAEAKPKGEDAARAMAILEDKSADTKYVVQVVAVTSQEKVDEVQGKLKDAGIKSFTQKVTTASGVLTRIRVGPFPNKEEAEKVRAKLSKIGLSSSLATS